MTVATGMVTGTRLVVRQSRAAEETEGGLIVAPAYQERPNQGEVLMVGSLAAEVQAGDKIWFRKYSGSPIELEEHGDVLILEEADVLFIERDGGY